jgi:hypothetical protein
MKNLAGNKDAAGWVIFGGAIALCVFMFFLGIHAGVQSPNEKAQREIHNCEVAGTHYNCVRHSERRYDSDSCTCEQRGTIGGFVHYPTYLP